MKLKTLLHIGKIVCEVGVIALGIVALCTPAAGVAIAAIVIGAVAWGLSHAEDAIKKDSLLDCDHTSLKISDKSKMDLASGDDDTDSLITYIDDLNYNADHSIVSIDDIPVSGDHICIVDEV